MFSGADGSYEVFFENDLGSTRRMRADDGVHFTRSGSNWLSRELYELFTQCGSSRRQLNQFIDGSSGYVANRATGPVGERTRRARADLDPSARRLRGPRPKWNHALAASSASSCPGDQPEYPWKHPELGGRLRELRAREVDASDAAEAGE